jgi:hypothetical protein
MRRISPRSIVSAIGLSVCLFVLLFIVNNFNVHPSDPDLLPKNCDCPTLRPETHAAAAPKVEVPPPAKVETPAPAKTETPVASKIDSVTSTRTPPPFPACKLVEKDSPVQRAIIIYYPHHQSEYFFPEVRWYVFTISIK